MLSFRDITPRITTSSCHGAGLLPDRRRSPSGGRVHSGAHLPGRRRCHGASAAGCAHLLGRTARGYLYITLCYSAEVGGRCVFLEEIYLLPEFRGKGLGLDILNWIEQSYPGARRLRLEVNHVNQGAVHLYEKAGYTYLRYEQMIIDKVK